MQTAHPIVQISDKELPDGSQVQLDRYATARVKRVTWEIDAFNVADGSGYHAALTAMHNGTPTTDATGIPETSELGAVQVGPNPYGVTFSVNFGVLNAEQVMVLFATASGPDWHVSVRPQVASAPG